MKRVFISFDFDHHEELRDALVGQAKNPSSPFEIADWSVKKPFEGNWKAKVRDRIRNEDGGFVAEAPEVPGCAAHGDTQQEAANVADSLRIRSRVGSHLAQWPRDVVTALVAIVWVRFLMQYADKIAPDHEATAGLWGHLTALAIVILAFEAIALWRSDRQEL